MTVTKLTKTQQRTQDKRENWSDKDAMAVAALTGRKADREIARDAAMAQVTKLLTGQAGGTNRKGAILALRAVAGLEAPAYDGLFEHFTGSLSDVAALEGLADPCRMARRVLAEREQAARNLGIWSDASARFEREEKAITRAAGAVSYAKTCEKVRAFLEAVRPHIERATAKLAERAQEAAQEAVTA